jgi:hypothetical protein
MASPPAQLLEGLYRPHPPGRLGPGNHIAHQGLMEFSMALKQPFFVLAALGGAADSEEASANAPLALGADRVQVPRNAGTDEIAVQIVNQKVNASRAKNSQRSHLFRTHLVENLKLADYWKTAPNTDQGKRLNVQHPEYDRFQVGLKILAPDFVVSYIRATYKNDLYFYNPDAQRRCGAVPIPFAAGPFDPLTVYCLHGRHEALLCPELKKWSEHLHDNVRYRAIKVIKNAAPEEEALEYLPKNGAAAGQVGPWRVNLTDVCNEAFKARGWIIGPGTPCGPFQTREEVVAFGERALETQGRSSSAAAAPAQGTSESSPSIHNIGSISIFLE